MTGIEQQGHPASHEGFHRLIAENSDDAEALEAIALRLLNNTKRLQMMCSELYRRRDDRQREIQARIDERTGALESTQRRRDGEEDPERRAIYAAKAERLAEAINELKWVLSILH